MSPYVHDWQPQRLNGVPGFDHWDADHADDKGHNHFGFLTKEMAAEAVAHLRAKGIKVWQWAGDPDAKIGGHKDPGHYDGRSFDVAVDQWSPAPDRAKEIAGQRYVEEVMDDFLHSKGVPEDVLPYRRARLSASGQAPQGRAPQGQAPQGQAPAGQTPQGQTPGGQTRTITWKESIQDDWRAAASAPNTSTDPSSQAYWQRQDMRIWAQANPTLARQTMARYGAKAEWLQAPSTHEVERSRVEQIQPPTPAAGAGTPASGTPASGTQASGTPASGTPAVRPPDRGALNGTRVGGAPPRRLQPYFFEIHADRSSAEGGQTGLIGSYLDRDNPVFQNLAKEYGTYGENYSRRWRDGTLGAPSRGLSIIETRTAGPGMADAAQHEQAAQRLFNSLTQDPDVKSGLRPLHFYAGHADTANPRAQGASGGDAPEKQWNTGVMARLRAQAEKAGLRNFNFHDAIVDDSPSAPNANWNRAKQLRDEWIRQSRGGGL